MYEYKAKILSVYDGDGVYHANVDMGMNLFQRKSLRLYGVDTPEIRGTHKDAGYVVRDVVRIIIQDKDIIIKTHKDKTGKYGRLLVDIIIDDMNLSDYLISIGYAKEYFGGKKPEWTEEELKYICKTNIDQN